jgi:hypothetical protein
MPTVAATLNPLTRPNLSPRTPPRRHPSVPPAKKTPFEAPMIVVVWLYLGAVVSDSRCKDLYQVGCPTVWTMIASEYPVKREPNAAKSTTCGDVNVQCHDIRKVDACLLRHCRNCTFPSWGLTVIPAWQRGYLRREESRTLTRMPECQEEARCSWILYLSIVDSDVKAQPIGILRNQFSITMQDPYIIVITSRVSDKWYPMRREWGALLPARNLGMGSLKLTSANRKELLPRRFGDWGIP